MPAKEYDDRTSIIVVDLNGSAVGLVIDSVSEVIKINDNEMKKKPEMSTKNGPEYVKNIGQTKDQIILVIDCDNIKMLPLQCCTVITISSV